FSGADGSLMRTYAAPAGTVNLGWGTSITDDLDGDGVRDHFLGAPGSGEAFAYSGATGDLIHVVNGPQTHGPYGQFFVAGIEDADGDGVGDLYVGDFADRFNSGSKPSLGAAYVYSGATGEEIHHFRGKGQTTGMGPGRWAGDVDGDGHEDLAVGAYTASNGDSIAGRVVIFSGRDGSVLRTITSTSPFEQLGFDCVGIGDVNGDGAPDYLVSAANRDRVAIIAGRPETCAGDLNRDGVIDSEDAAILTSAYEEDYKPGDLDGDADVDNDDLKLLLSKFGPCP
ncbi:MAG: FG-GAP-like repeat-containing protein, partial [Planctomycetota bacterium]